MPHAQHRHRTWYGPGTYVIRVQGSLRTTWSDRLGGMWIAPDEGHAGCTILAGALPDQTALIGVLTGLYDLGMPLLLVECVENDLEDVFLVSGLRSIPTPRRGN